MPCVFCTDVTQTGEVVFEDNGAWVVLHDDWAVPGHTMIVAKQHVENASDLDAENWSRLTNLWHKTERVLLERTESDRSIIMKLGVATPHLHIHIYPVSESMSRDEIFAAIDGKTHHERDPGLVEAIRRDLTALGD
jgi:diadenosine tetraphosphate (Ap4A) HIT family hydrolase